MGKNYAAGVVEKYPAVFGWEVDRWLQACLMSSNRFMISCIVIPVYIHIFLRVLLLIRWVVFR